MMTRASRASITLSSITLLLILPFNNCAKTPLTVDVPIFPASGKVSLCLKDYRPISYYYRNINLANYGGRLYPDNDADGLADHVETTFGMDPFRRRSLGPILDSVCLSAYGADPALCKTGCTAAEHAEKYMGLSRCDLKALSSPQNPIVDSRMTGWDTDFDAIPDFIEILTSSNALVANELDDADSDGMPTSMEVGAFRDPNHTDSSSPMERIRSELNQKTAPADQPCAGDYYEATLTQGPLTELVPYTSVEYEKLSHGTADNTYLIMVQLAHKTLPSDPDVGRRVLYRYIKVMKDEAPFSYIYDEVTSGSTAAVEEIP